MRLFRRKTLSERIGEAVVEELRHRDPGDSFDLVSEDGLLKAQVKRWSVYHEYGGPTRIELEL